MTDDHREFEVVVIVKFAVTLHVAAESEEQAERQAHDLVQLRGPMLADAGGRVEQRDLFTVWVRPR